MEKLRSWLSGTRKEKIKGSDTYFPEDIWNGGYYELVLELEDRSYELLAATMRRLWNHPALEGIYLDTDKEPSDQQRVDPDDFADYTQYRLYGLATLPSGQRVACGTLFLDLEEGPRLVELYISMAALAREYEVGSYPFDRLSHEHWQRPLDYWFGEIAMFVFAAVPFRVGLIGFELYSIEPGHADQFASQGIPTERHVAYLWPQNGQLQYLPANQLR